MSEYIVVEMHRKRFQLPSTTQKKTERSNSGSEKFIWLSNYPGDGPTVHARTMAFSGRNNSTYTVRMICANTHSHLISPFDRLKDLFLLACCYCCCCGWRWDKWNVACWMHMIQRQVCSESLMHMHTKKKRTQTQSSMVSTSKFYRWKKNIYDTYKIMMLAIVVTANACIFCLILEFFLPFRLGWQCPPRAAILDWTLAQRYELNIANVKKTYREKNGAELSQKPRIAATNIPLLWQRKNSIQIYFKQKPKLID